MKLFQIILFAFFVNCTAAQSRLRISLLTLTPGPELNEVFGHSALRVIDSNAVTDHVYNYGTFDFEDPNFYAKFVRGQLRYYVNVENYNDFVWYYKSVNRGITEQIIDFKQPEEFEKLKTILRENIKEENKYYQYDFFKDNCTTRLRDLISKCYLPTPQLPPVMPTTYTYRNAIHQYLNSGNMPWSKFGIDILLGAKTDKIMTSVEQEFLPDNLMLALDANKNGKIISLKRQVYEVQKIENKKSFFTPLVLTLSILLFYIIIHLLNSRNNKNRLGNIRLGSSPPSGELEGAVGLIRIFDFLLFFIIGLLSCLLIFMWWGTDHVFTKNNYNLLWASPLLLILAFVKNKKNSIAKYISIVYCISLVGILCLWIILPQQYNIAFAPIILLLLWRVFVVSSKHINLKNKPLITQ